MNLNVGGANLLRSRSARGKVIAEPMRTLWKMLLLLAVGASVPSWASPALATGAHALAGRRPRPHHRRERHHEREHRHEERAHQQGGEL